MVARKKLRPATPIFSVVLLATVFIDHAQEILSLGLRDIALMVLFVLMWAVIGLALGRESRQMPMTNALVSGFRNITMALAFSNIVFFHTNATSYVFAVTVVVLLLTQLAFTGRKLLGKRKAVGA